MPKIPPLSSKKFCSVLARAGCALVRVEGDHHIFVKEGVLRPIVVPLRTHLPTFIILNNLRTLGITRKEFFKLLKEV